MRHIVYPRGWGDPLLYSRLFDMIAVAGSGMVFKKMVPPPAPRRTCYRLYRV